MKTVLLLVTLIGAAGVSIGLFGGHAATERIEPSATTLLAAELGFDPESLAVAGFDAEDARALLGRLDAETSLQAGFAAAKSTSESAVFAVSAAAERLAENPADGELRAAYTLAVSDANAANAQVESIRADLIEAALEGTQTSQATEWRTCVASRGCRIPPAFTALSHSGAEAAELEECLIAEARASRLSTDLPPETAQRLAAIRGEMDVVVADQRLATHLVAIETVFAEH